MFNHCGRLSRLSVCAPAFFDSRNPRVGVQTIGKFTIKKKAGEGEQKDKLFGRCDRHRPLGWCRCAKRGRTAFATSLARELTPVTCTCKSKGLAYTARALRFWPEQTPEQKLPGGASAASSFSASCGRTL